MERRGRGEDERETTMDDGEINQSVNRQEVEVSGRASGANHRLRHAPIRCKAGGFRYCLPEKQKTSSAHPTSCRTLIGWSAPG